MRYKNTTNGVLIFRAHNAKGVKEVFNLKPDEEMESDREVTYGGLKLVGKGISNKKKKKGDA
jgi:hypothetical protein